MSANHSHTRMLFMGDAALADGFRLIGFEIWADPSLEQLEQLLRELVRQRQNALLVVDQRLAGANIPLLRQARAEGGHIVIASVPPLNNPNCFECQIDRRLQQLLVNGQATS